MNIGPEMESVWQDIILKKPECMPFRNAGWEIFDDVAELDPAKPKGSNAFHPITGQQGVSDVSTTFNSQSQSVDPDPSAGLLQSPTHSDRELTPDWNYSQMDADMTQTQTFEGEVNDGDLDISRTVARTLSFPDPVTPTPQSRGTKCPAMFPTSASASTTITKHLKPSSSHADAVHGLSNALDKFGATFKESSRELAAAINASPEHDTRRKKAREIMYATEDWLNARQKVVLANRFIDHRKADMYIEASALPSPDWKTWVAVELDLDIDFD